MSSAHINIRHLVGQIDSYYDGVIRRAVNTARIHAFYRAALLCTSPKDAGAMAREALKHDTEGVADDVLNLLKDWSKV